MSGASTKLTIDSDPTFNLDKMAKSPLYRTCRILCHLFTMIVVRFWKLCTSACLMLLLLYWFYGGALTFLFLMISIYGLFYYAQDMFLYYPDQPPNSRIFVDQPDKFKLPFENVFVKTKDGVSINMYLVKNQNTFAFPTVMMLHGNAGNIGHRLMMTYYLYKIAHCNVLMVEYRGYGKSSGKPSESGIYQDAEAAFEWLLKREDIDSKKIFILGSSLGGAVSIKLTSNPQYAGHIAGLMLENTFTSLPDVAKSLFSLKALDFLPTFCYKNQFPSEYRIGKITVPTLFLSGQSDELIPPRMMQALYNLSGSNLKRLVPFEGGTHNDTCLCPGYYESISQFMYEVINSSKGNKDTSQVTIETDSSII
ncbi:protein ABHD13-like [Ruditapes philippinarum]|uniref:protein ABHD13-like n=1 Tax=Ruditapes philippinarum TaxID=129788 RepID=UPI00295A9CE6|nr:protein ABHD13-like [Ruditapes philippinarum]